MLASQTRQHDAGRWASMDAIMKRLCSLFVLTVVLTSCCRKSTAPGESGTAVTTGQWTTSRPVTSHEWFIDGKDAGGGSQAKASDQVFFTLTRHADDIGYVLQIGTASGRGSDTIHYDTSAVPTIKMPTNGSLVIKGPTSIFRLEERTQDGRVTKTRELFIN